MSKKAVVTEYRLTVPRLCSPLKIALVADIHERKADDILELLVAAKPDLIAVAGDTFERFDLSKRRRYEGNGSLARFIFLNAAIYVNWFFINILSRRNLPDTQNSYRFLEGAASEAPVFLSLGNHEECLEEDDLAFLQKNGITLLDNADVEVNIKGNSLIIGGLSNTPDEAWLADFSEKKGFRLLLCHRPETYDSIVSSCGAELVLAGHNHGGQIRVRDRGLFASGGGFLPKYHRGVFDDRLVVTAGCSNTVAMPRINNPRELVIINLIPEKK